MKAKFITGLIFGSLIAMITSKNIQKMKMKKRNSKMRHMMIHPFKYMKSAVKL